MLGWILGALAVGAILSSGDSSSSSSSSSSRTYSNSDHYYISGPTSKRRYTNNTSTHKYTSNGQEEKVEFFDKYRELDVRLARLIGEGSGGIGLFILAYRYRKINAPSISHAVENLVEVKDYRNNLAHKRTQWRYMDDPRGYYVDTIREISSFVDYHSSDVARGMMAEKKILDAKRNGGRR